jgi:DNA replication protein DnaC
MSKKRTFTTHRKRAEFLALSANQTRQATRRQQAHDVQAALDRWLHRWHNDPESILADLRWICEHCGRTVEPYVIEGFQGRRPVVGRRERCGCEGEELDLAYRADLEREAERRRQMSFYDQRLTNAGLVGWLRDATFESARDGGEDGEHKRLALEYCTALLGGALEHPWLLFHGPVGTGKSHLAAAIVHTCVDAGWDDAYFRPWLEWINRLRDSFGDDTVKSHELTAELGLGRLVVLDDLSKQGPTRTGYAESQLFNVLSVRYDKNLPTVITLNHKLSDPLVASVIGHAGIDRIIGATGGKGEVAQRVEFRGRSKRSGIDFGKKGSDR